MSAAREARRNGFTGGCGEGISVGCLENVENVGCRELVGGGCGKEFAMVTRTMLDGETIWMGSGVGLKGGSWAGFRKMNGG